MLVAQSLSGWHALNRGSVHLRKPVYLFAALAITTYTQAFFPFIRSTDGGEPLDAWYFFQWTSVYLTSFAVWSAAVLKGKPRVAPANAALISLSTISILWSGDPARSLTYTIVLAANIATAESLARHLALAELDRIFRIVLSFCAIINIILYYLFPFDFLFRTGLGVDGFQLEYQGIFPHKTETGTLHGVGLCLSANAFLYRKSFVAAFQVLVNGIALVLTAALTPLLASIVTLALLVLILRSPHRYVKIIGVATLIAMLAFVFALPLVSRGDLFSLFGKDASLTGRVPIWRVVVDYILISPWIGYGADAFFSEGNIRTAGIYSAFEYYTPPNSHNMAMEILVYFGVVGAALFVWAFLSIFRSMTLLTDRVSGEYTIVYCVLAVYLIGAATNVEILRVNTFGCFAFLYFASYFSVVRSRRSRLVAGEVVARGRLMQ